jgi:hypothetical protein
LFLLQGTLFSAIYTLITPFGGLQAGSQALSWLIMGTASRKIPLYDRPAAYQIRVQGWLDPAWSERLEGMTLYQTKSEEPGPITSLQGELFDQAALAGVLNTLYQLHLTIISVKRLGS